MAVRKGSAGRSSSGGVPNRAKARKGRVQRAARARFEQARGIARKARGREPLAAPPDLPEGVEYPYLALVHTPTVPKNPELMGCQVTIATYNVHRWTGMNGRRAPDAARAGFVLSEIGADVVALQEVLRPWNDEDPLEAFAEAEGLHLAFAVTRAHKRGQLGNAILSRFPIHGLSVLDISHSRIERRGALAAQFGAELGHLGVVATHLSLVDRTRHLQVQSLLEHPQLNAGPAVLVGDMNAWRKCKATRTLEGELHRHNNVRWPASFPAAAPVLSLDRIYARGAKMLAVRSHDSVAARRASDHLPVVATIDLPDLA